MVAVSESFNYRLNEVMHNKPEKNHRYIRYCKPMVYAARLTYRLCAVTYVKNDVTVFTQIKVFLTFFSKVNDNKMCIVGTCEAS